MLSLKGLKNFLLKESYDFDRADINLYNFHPQFCMALAIQGVFFGHQNSYRRLIWPIYCILLSFIGLGLLSVFIHHALTVEDYSFATICACYIVPLGAIPVVNISVLYNKRTILKLADEVNENFISICTLGPRHRKPFLHGQLNIWKLCCLWFIIGIFCTTVNIPIIVISLMFQTLLATQDENTKRPLVFPVWLPKRNAYETPYYEIFFVLETKFCIMVFTSFCSYVYILFHLLFHYMDVMDMIILDFEIIFENLDENVISLPPENPRRREVQKILNKRMKRIVNWQLHVYKGLGFISSTYGVPIVYQVLLSSFAICLTMFQFTWKLDSGHFEILSAMLIAFGAVVQLWVPCYLGALLRNKAFAVRDACWNCGWHTTALGRLLRTDIIITILRTQHPLSIKFTGLPNVDLETFTSIMTSAYSYFNVLIQYNK